MDQIRDRQTGRDLTESDIKRSSLLVTLSNNGLEGVIAEGGDRPLIRSHIVVQGKEAARDFLRRRELARPFGSTTLYIDEGGSYTLVPRDFTSGGVTPRHWLSDLPEGHCLQSTTISDLGIDLIFTTTEETFDECQSALQSPSYAHPAAALALAGAIYSRRRYPRTLMALVSDGHTDLCYCESGHLRLANRYTIADRVDLLYYITSVWEHFHLDKEQDHLLLFAEESDEVDSATRLLRDAVANVRVNDYGALCAHPEELADIHSPIIRLALICA